MFFVGCTPIYDIAIKAPRTDTVVGEHLQLQAELYGQVPGIGDTSCASTEYELVSPQPAPTEYAWSVRPAEGASVDARGLFQATAPGWYYVRCELGSHEAWEEDMIIVTDETTVTTETTEVPEIQQRVYTSEPTGLWDNHNVGGVQNGGTSPTFDLVDPVLVTYLETYHYNDSQGTAATGEISLESADGTIYGPYPTEGAPGQGDVPNAYWIARPDVELPAGSYTVIDSEPATWSQNAESGGEGMVRMMGVVGE